MNIMMASWFKIGIAVAVASTVGLISISQSVVADHHKEGEKHEVYQSKKPETVKGEVVDLMCYLNHGAKGPDHANCAKKCIRPSAKGGKGGPVGILTDEGDAYIVWGDHEGIDREKWAKRAAQTVTVKGKILKRAGLAGISNAQIVN